MPPIKNTSSDRKDTDFLALFIDVFGEHLNLARIRFINLFVLALCKSCSVNYSKISNAFDNNSNALSNYRRIQRFMAKVELPMDLVSKLIFKLIPKNESVVLLIDRTNWKLGDANINILMLAVSYKNVSFPLMFKMLDKKGNSNTQERIDLMNKFICLFGTNCIDCLIADREFIGKKWVGFLNDNRIRYFIRVRNNFKVKCPRNQTMKPAWHYFNQLKIGQISHFSKIFEIKGELCYLSGCKTIKEGKLDYLIIISFNKPDEAIKYYAQRWQIESMFRAFKSSGFNLEDTHVTIQDRLEKLIMLTMIAFVWCYKVGDHIDQKLKPIKIKKHGRRAISIFKYGLEAIARYLLS
ncbi:MAG: IS4 family transposase, partial [Cryomorphaceae bacterium]|nr:IS4 family transposase [Cryomorphaceae bacterium]